MGVCVCVRECVHVRVRACVLMSAVFVCTCVFVSSVCKEVVEAGLGC